MLLHLASIRHRFAVRSLISTEENEVFVVAVGSVTFDSVAEMAGRGRSHNLVKLQSEVENIGKTLQYFDFVSPKEHALENAKCSYRLQASWWYLAIYEVNDAVARAEANSFGLLLISASKPSQTLDILT